MKFYVGIAMLFVACAFIIQSMRLPAYGREHDALNCWLAGFLIYLSTPHIMDIF